MSELLAHKSNASCKWSATRHVLWILVFTGFAVNYMIRLNLNIAIVAMVKPRAKVTWSTVRSECQSSYENETINEERENLNDNKTLDWIPSSSTDLNSTVLSDSKFDWSERVQGNVLGSFFWLHWVTQVPGGVLAGRFGTKVVFGMSNFLGILICIGIPYFAYLGYEYLMFLRLVQGLLCGFAWPSMHHLVGKWIPPNERSKFITAYLGSSVGAAITYPLCGFIIAQWGWQYVFYTCTVIGAIWFGAWQWLVFDTPDMHPRISDEEKRYIVESLADNVSHEKMVIPWSRILKSRDVWMNIVAQIGGNWGFFTLMTHAPTYFKFIHGWDIMATGLLSGMPHMVRMVWAYLFSAFADYLLETQKMSRTNVRKMGNFFSCCVQGIFMICLAYSGCNSLAAIIFLTSAVAVFGSNSSGALSAAVDISPNFGSIILGLTNTGAAIVGFLTPAVVGYLTFRNQTSLQWQKVFWIATSISFAAGICFTIFSKADVRSWNASKKSQDKIQDETESMLDQKDIN